MLRQLAAKVAVASLVISAVVTTGANAGASATDGASGISVDRAAKELEMCGDRYCATLDYDQAAVIRTLEIDGQQVLDPAEGIYSSVTTDSVEISSQNLLVDPRVTVEDDTVVVEFRTAVAEETWTLEVHSDRLRFTLARRYLQASVFTEQGAPMMTFAEDSFDNMRWPDDGGNFPLGGSLVNSKQPMWLAGGKQVNTNIRTSKEQVSYVFLDRRTRSALDITGTTNRDGLTRGRATEVWRSREPAGNDLRVAIVTSAQGLEYTPAGIGMGVFNSPLGYAVQTTRDGSPVFQPVAVTPGQEDRTTLEFRPGNYDKYYDLGSLNGVDEQALSRAINDYARWMMQDTNKGASTEQPQLQSEVPPLEMHHIGQLLELFPDPGALRSFQIGLEDIRDWLVEGSGRVTCCVPGLPPFWGHDYGDQAPGYVLGVVKAYQLTGDREWLTTPAGKGRFPNQSMKDSVERVLTYLIEEWTDPTSHFVRNVNPKLTRADYDNDYWESSTGEFNGYSTALLYEALVSWANVERDVLQGDHAGKFAAVAETIKTHFNKDVADGGFWSPSTETFLYGSGNQDALYLPVNAQVLKTDLASRSRRAQIVEALEEQNAAGNYDLHPMNVRDLYTEGAVARTAGKGGENGGWYGAPDGEFYAGLPLLQDPQVLQTAAASFLTRYKSDGFYGASTWDRDDPLSRTGAALWFPTTVMPAWGLYRYGYGFQPQLDRLVIAPYITQAMVGSTVRYTWRGTPLRVTYESVHSYSIVLAGESTTPLTVRWINQRPGSAYHVNLDGSRRVIRADSEGNVEVAIPTGSTGQHQASCRDCEDYDSVDSSASTPAVSGFSPNSAEPRNDRYGQFGMQLAVGPRPVEVSSLGRYSVPGNRGVHRVKLLDVDGRVVASAPVDMSTAQGGGSFVSVPLTKPVVLQPGLYYLYSVEAKDGDRWYGAGGQVTTSPGITVLGAASGRSLSVREPGSTSFGPLNFGYREVSSPRSWIQALTSPDSVDAASGEEVTFDITVYGQSRSSISGVVDVALPQGWTATTPQSFTIPTVDGGVASTTVPVKVKIPADAATKVSDLTFTASTSTGLISERTATVSVANLIYDFDNGTVQGWQPGPRVRHVRAVTNMANGPGTPYHGSHLLEVDVDSMRGTDPRTIFVEPSRPLDLSDASTVYAHVNSYGAWPHTPERYEATITLYSGSDKIAATSAYTPNVWNRVEIDVSSWEKRSEVTRIEITYTVHLPDTTSYDLMFDLDALGFDV